MPSLTTAEKASNGNAYSSPESGLVANTSWDVSHFYTVVLWNCECPCEYDWTCLTRNGSLFITNSFLVLLGLFTYMLRCKESSIIHDFRLLSFIIVLPKVISNNGHTLYSSWCLGPMVLRGLVLFGWLIHSICGVNWDWLGSACYREVGDGNSDDLEGKLGEHVSTKLGYWSKARRTSTIGLTDLRFTLHWHVGTMDFGDLWSSFALLSVLGQGWSASPSRSLSSGR